tara:strand:+ start:54 stop:425 length:372 start_codon:yes stop_codon:yes gene_type:complete
MAKVDLKAKAKECLEFNKLDNVVAVVEDGTCFLRKAENHATNYANSKGLKIEVFTREELFAKEKETSVSEENKNSVAKEEVIEPDEEVTDKTSKEPVVEVVTKKEATKNAKTTKKTTTKKSTK